MSGRICANCGAEIPEGGHFCVSCGTPSEIEAPVDETKVIPPLPPVWDAPAQVEQPSEPPVAGGSWQPTAEPTTEEPPTQQQAPVTPPAAPQPSYAPPAMPPHSYAPPATPPPAQQSSAPNQPEQTQQVPTPPTWQPPSQGYTAAPPWQPPANPATQSYPSVASAPVATTGKKKSNVFSALLAFVGAILMVAGVFAPWVRTVVSSGISGWDSSDDAKVVVGIAVATLLVGVMLVAGVRGILLKLLLVGLGIAGIVLAVVNILSVNNDLPEVLNAQIGVGLVLVPVGGFLVFLSGLISRRSK